MVCSLGNFSTRQPQVMLLAPAVACRGTPAPDTWGTPLVDRLESVGVGGAPSFPPAAVYCSPQAPWWAGPCPYQNGECRLVQSTCHRDLSVWLAQAVFFCLGTYTDEHENLCVLESRGLSSMFPEVDPSSLVALFPSQSLWPLLPPGVLSWEVTSVRAQSLPIPTPSRPQPRGPLGAGESVL